jgi:pyrroloquinoline quinone biosynthesis protein E
MPLAAFKQLIDEQYGLVEIKLNGLGEALLQGDDYFEMISYARERRIWVRMTTNASLLHLRDNARKLIASGVNEIDISIDGADAPTFEGIRIQSDFGRVTANCKLLNALLAGAGKPSAKMWTLVQRANYVRLEEHVHLAAGLGFRHLVFSMQLHGWGSDALAERNRGEMVHLDDGRLQELVALGEQFGVRVSFWDVSEKFEATPGKRCPWPFERAVVTSDLRTVPCCMIGDPDAFELGKGQSFLQAWSGDEYRAFRQAHLDGQIPQVCTGCYR